MLIKKFPVPCRVDYVPSPYEPDEDGVQDVGYYNGKLSDGRAYRLECWRMDDMLMLTVMFSDRCLEGYRREDMALLLELLLRNRGQVMPRAVLQDRIWGIDSDVTDNNLDVHIRLLRKKIMELNGEELIKTMRGVGYYVE